MRIPWFDSESPKAVLKSAVGYGLVLVFLIVCGEYVVSHRQDFAFVAAMSLPELVGAALMILATVALNAFQLNLFLKWFGISLGSVELTAVTAGMLLGNLLLPMRGGTGGLAVYLKAVHGLNFRAFAAIYAGTGLLILLMNAGLAMASLAVIFFQHGFVHAWLTIFVTAVFAFSFYLSVFPPPVRWKRKGIIGKLFQAGHSWHKLTRNRQLLFSLTLSFLAMAFTVAAALYLIYRALGMPLQLTAALVTSSLGNIASLVPLTPGSLGIFDAVAIQIPQLFGMDAARSIAAALTFRVLSLLWMLVLGIPGIIYLSRSTRAVSHSDTS